MSLFERAWLYITRKRGKTLIMFCILFAMASGILSGISSYAAGTRIGRRKLYDESEL